MIITPAHALDVDARPSANDGIVIGVKMSSQPSWQPTASAWCMVLAAVAAWQLAAQLWTYAPVAAQVAGTVLGIHNARQSQWTAGTCPCWWLTVSQPYCNIVLKCSSCNVGDSVKAHQCGVANVASRESFGWRVITHSSQAQYQLLPTASTQT